MAIFKCKMCGGALEITEGQTVCECEYCGSQQTLPRLSDDKKANMYDRANHFRRNNDFDKAMGIYEQILNEDNTDAEAYWSLVLCRYGIEYVDDPATHKRIPTVNRAQYTSIFDDADYKAAIANSDSMQKTVYEDEAKAINEIQKGILEISQREEPFDVFICYKETDNDGRRTQDSVLANDLYHQLTQEGFKVFFARITLEDKLGSAYEPYIFAALNSAKVMVVLGTKPEFFNAVWVKNEWSRFLSLIKAGASKFLIPAYKDMDPYDLPEEFSHLQAQDMSKLGFMQDLIRGIKKIIGADQPQMVSKETVVVQQSSGSANTENIDALIKRGNMALEDGEFAKANEFYEMVLNIDAECVDAYLGKWMASEYCESFEDIRKKYLQDVSGVENGLENSYYSTCDIDGSDHINEMVTKYAYTCRMLEKQEILKMYDYDLGYKNLVPYWEVIKNNYYNRAFSNKNVKRIIQYGSSGELKEKIEQLNVEVNSMIDDNLRLAFETAKKNENEVKEQYRQFVESVDERIIKEYEEWLGKMEEEYKCIKNQYANLNLTNQIEYRKWKERTVLFSDNFPHYKDVEVMLSNADTAAKDRIKKQNQIGVLIVIISSIITIIALVLWFIQL